MEYDYEEVPAPSGVHFDDDDDDEDEEEPPFADAGEGRFAQDLTPAQMKAYLAEVGASPMTRVPKHKKAAAPVVAQPPPVEVHPVPLAPPEPKPVEGDANNRTPYEKALRAFCMQRNPYSGES